MSGSSESLRSAADLVAAGLVPASRLAEIARVTERYAVALTPEVVNLVDKADPADPIARQFVPDTAELETLPFETPDPIGDQVFSPVEGIVHRYPDRVLLKLLHVCPVYCRFCFRRETVGPASPVHLAPKALDKALAYIAERPAIWEVILTGGDPLMLARRRLEDVVSRLDAIAHVKILRIHTRVPAVDPGRIDRDLVALLRACGKTVFVVLHANHPREFSAEARAACSRLVEAGIPMLSQSVLLAGVNDDLATLEALMRTFVENRIKPYYLHQLDPAPGTARFRVPIARGRALMRDLLGRLSGLCQPTYVLDLPGGFGKVPIGPTYIEATPEDDVFAVRDHLGRTHVVPSKGAASRHGGDVRQVETSGPLRDPTRNTRQPC